MMTNLQAASLRPDHRVRRKQSSNTITGGDRAIYVVERVEPKEHLNGSVTIHAGGQVFKPWEIERVRYEGWS
jgi:hypothetical protein